MIERIHKVLHVAPIIPLHEVSQDELEERFEAVIEKIDSLEARVELLEAEAPSRKPADDPG